uniref:Nitroreductase family protein n=1 Tax=Ignisphaera aggregans TaxID=334771 RepID=A0A7J3QF93_9CREN
MSEDIFKVIMGRRCIRSFKDMDISNEYIVKILEAGIWAPSAGNIQPWEFIVVRNKDMIEKIKLVSPGLFGDPNTVIVICINLERARKGGKAGERMALMDISMAAQNMMLMAYSLGIGSCPIVSFSKIGIKELLEIPDTIEPVLLITLGYPNQWPKAPERRPLNEVVHYEKYGKHC